MTSIFITCLFCVNLLSIYVAFKYCRQNKTGRKKAARTKAKGYRDLQNLKVKLDNKTKEAEIYKKRLQRMQNVQRDTPRSKTRRMLGGVKVRESVRKTLLFHNALITGLRDKYKNLKFERDGQVYSKVVASLSQIGNMDETPVFFDLPSNRTVDCVGSKTVSVCTTGHEKLISPQSSHVWQMALSFPQWSSLKERQCQRKSSQ